jgi:hypothetical protein
LSIEIENPPNTAPPPDRVWMFVSRAAEGRENVCGGLMWELGWQPMITGNPKVHEIHKAFARRMADADTGKTIHLLVFTNRTEIESW